MAVYREGFHALELIKRRSVQVFRDAADFGAPTKRNDEIWMAAKQLCDWYGIKESRKVSRYLTGRSVTKEVQLIDEWAVSDGIKTIQEATTNYIVNFVTCTTGACKGKDGYINIVKK